MAVPARPDVPGSKPYTGFNGNAPGIKGGTAQWIRDAKRTSGGVVWSLGAWGVRDQRSHKGRPSVHGTGRAWDAGYSRRQGDRHQPSWGRDAFLPWLDLVIANANTLGIELALDYWPEPWGRGWRCDRQAWETYDRRTIAGAPGGQWVHFELSCRYAGNAALVKQGFDAVFPEIPRT